MYMWLNSAQGLQQENTFLLHMCASIMHVLWCQSHFTSFTSRRRIKTFQTNRPNFISNGLLHCRQILYCLSHQASWMYLITINQSIKVFWRYFNIFHLCVSTYECFGLSRWWLVVKNPSANVKRCRLDPWVRKIPWRRAWQPTPVFLPGEPHGQRTLAGYNAQRCKESDTTEATSQMHACTQLWVFQDLYLDCSDTNLKKNIQQLITKTRYYILLK